jgi:hypothetical protein
MYTVYKTTNLKNGKHYIGVHKTDNPNDGYLGSGRAIEEAVRKYGRDSFEKEIIFITESKEEAYKKETELTLDFNTNKTYNMRLGGAGGFTKENAHKGYNKVKDVIHSVGGKASTAKLTTVDRQERAKRGWDRIRNKKYNTATLGLFSIM